MQRTSGETSLAGWSIFILVVVLVTLYIIFFSLPEKKVLSNDELVGINNQGDTPATVIAHVQESGVYADNEMPEKEEFDLPSRGVESDFPRTQSVKQIPVVDTSPSFIVSSQQLFNPSENSLPGTITDKSVLPQQILYLAGTHHRVGVMKSAKFLGFEKSIKYILKNNDNTHFAYLGKELPDVADSLTALGGKTVAITVKNDIHTHGLFGDKLIFLLVPQYIGKKQLFFVYFAEARDRWFIQVDTDTFETTKPLLRELFAKRYNR